MSVGDGPESAEAGTGLKNGRACPHQAVAVCDRAASTAYDLEPEATRPYPRPLQPEDQHCLSAQSPPSLPFSASGVDPRFGLPAGQVLMRSTSFFRAARHSGTAAPPSLSALRSEARLTGSCGAFPPSPLTLLVLPAPI